MAGQASRENGKLGGRKPGVSTLEREKARQYIAERIGEYMPEIFNALIKNAKKGDIPAIKELFDRAFGKAPQSLDHTTNGNELPTPILNVLYNNFSEENSPTQIEN